MASGRVVGAVNPVAVALARLDPWDVGMPDIPIDLDQLDARLPAVVVDQAQLNLGRHFREKCEVHAGAIECRT
jgi:hypothetical protein